MNKQLRAARTACGWTQEHVASEIAVDLRNYRRWEHGQTQPSLCNLGKLCRLFNKSREELGYE